jgi:excinuclease ABC subunit C
MQAAAEAEQFEKAAHLRDAIKTIGTLAAWRNKMEAPAMGDRDAFGLKAGHPEAWSRCSRSDAGASRTAWNLSRIGLTRPAISTTGHCSVSRCSSSMRTAWRRLRCIRPWNWPDDEGEAIESWLSARAERRVRLVTPKRGEKRGLLDLAARNAAVAYQSHFGDGATTAFDALDTLRSVLNLPALPRRIECFDISTFQGRETVAVDGGRRRRPPAKERIQEVQDPGK